MQGICNYMTETNHVSRVYTAAALLWLQFTVHVLLSPTTNVLNWLLWLLRLCILAILVLGPSVLGPQVNKQNCIDVDDNIAKWTEASPALLVCCVSMLSHISIYYGPSNITLDCQRCLIQQLTGRHVSVSRWPSSGPQELWLAGYMQRNIL